MEHILRRRAAGNGIQDVPQVIDLPLEHIAIWRALKISDDAVNPPLVFIGQDALRP